MAARTKYLIALLACFVLACNVAMADSVEGTGVFATNELSDANNQVMNTITITDSGTIKNISVTINRIEHTNAGDLIAELRYLGPGGPSGPGGEPAYLFFRPNVDDVDVVGSRGNLNGDYTFTDDATDANFWIESAIPDDQTIPDQSPFFASDENGSFHDLAGIGFFEGFDVAGDWQLIITDGNTGINENNDGTVLGWTVEFHVVNIPEPGSVALIALLSGIAVSRRRR